MSFFKKIFLSNDIKNALLYLNELSYKYNNGINNNFLHIKKTLEEILITSSIDFIKAINT
jgi:hypothetical protein